MKSVFEIHEEIPIQIFLKAPLAPIYTNIEKERAPKNATFWSKCSKMCPQTAFLTCFFFQKFASGAKNLVKLGHYSVLRALQKSFWSTPKNIRGEAELRITCDTKQKKTKKKSKRSKKLDPMKRIRLVLKQKHDKAKECVISIGR